MKVHFIAIGGSAMHNLAIALSRKGYQVTGSDDEIFEPSKSRLDNEGLLPPTIGWNPQKITHELDAIILGMHAREDNPELLKAKEIGCAIYSYPEYLFEQSKSKNRIVIGGSHGKTTITSMILHALKQLQFPIDYMVGAQLNGYDCMVKLSEENKNIILEGDEYLSSPIDHRSKFHLYQPHVALLSGIAWDHINVFPSFDNYVEQFTIFCSMIEDGGTLIYNSEDLVVERVALKEKDRIQLIPYKLPQYSRSEVGTLLKYKDQSYSLKIFGAHNLQNIMGAMHIVSTLGFSADHFFQVMTDFTGAGKRLEKIATSKHCTIYKDFAHSPSKLKATTSAVKEQYPDKKLIACMELHTFSSLKKNFLPQYHHAMKNADKALVYFNPEVVKHKKLPAITPEEIEIAFGDDITVVTHTQDVLEFIHREKTNQCVLLMMSSGDFGGINYQELATI